MGEDAFDTCLLGHRRLAIVDLESGAQPMRGAGGHTAITFNGEIYGYREVRASLGGYPFRTASDTEAILALYERFGESFVERLPGMFAFALWDESRKTLICARDRFGEKPFYYALTPAGELIFASELKALLASGLVEPTIDRNSIAHYLQRLYVHPYRSIYENIAVLPPAHVLVFEQGRLRIRRYWRLPTPLARISLNEAAEEVARLMEDSVRRQLVADVPVGAFLSGGLDSTTVVQVARRFAPDLTTYSYDFEGGTSEIEFARAVAQAYGTRHRELRTPRQRIGDLLLRMAGAYDEPFADSSSIPTYLLSQAAREHVKVVLTGDGGDELLGGYEWYKPLAWMLSKQRVSSGRRLLARVLSRFAKTIGAGNAHQLELRSLGYGYSRTHGDVLEAHLRQLEIFSTADLRILGLPRQEITTIMQGWSAGFGAGVDSAMRFDIGHYMPGDILTKIDRASMAHGLELRAPFLDVALAEFLISLPAALKLSTTADKIVMRQAFSVGWPEAVRGRDKQGFGAPMHRWLTEPDVQELRAECLDSDASALYSHVSRRELSSVLRRGGAIHQWAALVLALWLEQRRGIAHAPRPGA